jgi:hypothetical protein
LRYFEIIQNCQPEFKINFRKYLEAFIGDILGADYPLGQFLSWSFTDKIDCIIAHLYNSGFFELEFFEKYIKEVLKFHKRLETLSIGVLIKMTSICSSKLHQEKPLLYIDLLQIAYDFLFQTPKAKKDTLRIKHEENYPGEEVPFEKMCEKMLREFHGFYPTNPVAGYPSPSFKIFVMNAVEGFKIENFCIDDKCVHFFAHYAPEGKTNEEFERFLKIIQDFSCEGCPRKINEKFLEMVKNFKSFNREKFLRVLKFISEMFLRSLMDFKIFEEIFHIVVGNLMKSKKEFYVQCFEELLTEAVVEKLRENHEMMRYIEAANKRVKEINENASSCSFLCFN